MVGRQRQCALNPARGVARTCTGRTTTLVPDGRAWVEINSARLIMRMHPHARLCRSSMVRRSRGYGRGCCCYLDRETWDDPRAGCVDHLLGRYQAGHSCLLWTVDTPTSPHATPSRTTQIGRIDRRQFHRGDCKGLLADVPVERSGSSNAVSGETIVRPQCPRRGTYMVAQPHRVRRRGAALGRYRFAW
jgi:hypothetical protein